LPLGLSDPARGRTVRNDNYNTAPSGQRIVGLRGEGRLQQTLLL
jgi:hypothetical protein